MINRVSGRESVLAIFLMVDDTSLRFNIFLSHFSLKANTMSRLTLPCIFFCLTAVAVAQDTSGQTFSTGADDTITYSASNNMSSSTTKTYYTENGGNAESSARPGWDSPSETTERTVRIKVPDSSRPSSGYPMIVWLHGDNEKTNTLNLDLWDKVEDTLKPVIVMPRGTLPVDIGSNKVENAYVNYTWNNAPTGDNHNMMTVANRVVKEDDIGFIDSLIDYMLASKCGSSKLIDPDQIYIGGHSSGGFLTYEIARRRNDIAGITVSGASIRCPVSTRVKIGSKVTVQQWGGYSTASKFAEAVSNKTRVVVFHGKKDDTVPFDGKTVDLSSGVTDPLNGDSVTGSIQYFLSQNDVIDAWTQINGIDNDEYETKGNGKYWSGTNSNKYVTIGSSPHSLHGAPYESGSEKFATMNAVDTAEHVSFANSNNSGLLLRFGLLCNGYPAGIDKD